MNKPRLVLFELHHLGDAVMSAPFVIAAAERYEVMVVCAPGAEELYGLVEGRPEVLVFRAPWAGGGFGWGRWVEVLRLVRALRAWRPAVAACVWADPRAHLLMRWAGAEERCGFPVHPVNYYGCERPWRRRNMWAGRMAAAAAGWVMRGRLLTVELTRHDYHQSHMDDWDQLGAALGVASEAVRRGRCDRPWFRVEGDLPAAAAAAVARAREAGRPVCLVHAGGRLPTKRWPVERFAAVARSELAGRGVPALLVRPPGGPGWPGCETWGGGLCVEVETPSVADLVRVVAAADVVLCNDSFVSHLAAGLGKRVVSVFGSGEPRWFAPEGSRAYAVGPGPCPHHPCIDRCVMPSYVCLEGVSEAEVARVLRIALGGLPGGEA